MTPALDAQHRRNPFGLARVSRIVYYIPYTSIYGSRGALAHESTLPLTDRVMPRPLGVTSLKILAAVRDGDAYGLEIVSRTGLPSGTVYPTLGRLKKSGLVRAHWEDQRTADRDGRPRRRYYDLTGDGKTALAEGTARLVEAAAELESDLMGEAG